MKAQSEIIAEAMDAQPQSAVPFWAAALLAASLGSWALIIGAARLLAGF
jgi:hypothetical protein